MNTNDVRKMIEEKISEESKTNSFKNHLTSIADQAVAVKVIEFTKNYLRTVPNLMDNVYAIAKQHNLLNQFQPIFDGVFNYWIEEYDYIPDSYGLNGICDDAYLSMSLMHLIANTQVRGHGVLLENVDLSHVNHDMGILLGPEIRSQLDTIVNATYQSINIQNSISELLNLYTGGIPVGNYFSAVQNMVDQQRMDDLVTTQLGAMGIF